MAMTVRDVDEPESKQVPGRVAGVFIVPNDPSLLSVAPSLQATN